MYTAHEISSKTLFKVGFWGVPPSPLQLGHQHNSQSSVSDRWLERCKLQAHAQQKKKEFQREGGFTPLSPCRRRCFTREHRAPSRSQRLPLHCVQTVLISEEKVVAKVDQTTVCPTQPHSTCTLPPSHPSANTFFYTSSSSLVEGKRR